MIDARDIIDLRLSADRQRIRLRFRDAAGQTVELSLPACWLNAMLEALPRTAHAEAVHPLDSWSMVRLGNGQDLVLTLRTPEGQAVSFAVKPWHVEGMATIATYSDPMFAAPRTLH